MKKLMYQLEDDPDQINLFNAIFKDDTKLEYKGFKTCNEFLAALKEKLPDICLIDLNLEEGIGAGFMVIKAIRSNLCNKLPIIVLSRRGDKHDITYAFTLGADDYVIKPIDIQLIRPKIHSLIDENFVREFSFKLIKKPIKARLKLELIPVNIDESYLYFESPCFIQKQTQVDINHPLLEEIFGNKDKKFRVHECLIDDNNEKYTVKVIGWNANEEYFDNLKNYLLEKCP